MKSTYEVEYISKDGRFTIERFTTRAAAFKKTRDHSITWERVIERKPNGNKSILSESKPL